MLAGAVGPVRALGPGALGVAPALVGSSSLWQQQEECSLQEAANTAERGHEPVGMEARVCADHTFEDISLGGKKNGIVSQARQPEVPSTLL